YPRRARGEETDRFMDRTVRKLHRRQREDQESEDSFRRSVEEHGLRRDREPPADPPGRPAGYAAGGRLPARPPGADLPQPAQDVFHLCRRHGVPKQSVERLQPAFTGQIHAWLAPETGQEVAQSAVAPVLRITS